MLTVIRLIPPAFSKPVLIHVILRSLTAKCFNPLAAKWEKYESSHAVLFCPLNNQISSSRQTGTNRDAIRGFMQNICRKRGI